MHVRKQLGQQRPGQLGAARREPAHHFGRVLDGKVPVARIDPLRRKGQVEILARDQARLLEDGQDAFLGRAGVGSALQDDQLPPPQTGRYTPGRLFYVDEDTWIISMKDQYDNRGNFWRFAVGMNYHDYTLPGVISTPWLNFDVTVPFWAWEGAYHGKTNFIISREKEVNPEAYFTPEYLLKSGRR